MRASSRKSCRAGKTCKSPTQGARRRAKDRCHLECPPGWQTGVVVLPIHRRSGYRCWTTFSCPACGQFGSVDLRTSTGIPAPRSPASFHRFRDGVARPAVRTVGNTDGRATLVLPYRQYSGGMDATAGVHRGVPGAPDLRFGRSKDLAFP
jgi:hypothetical protein